GRPLRSTVPSSQHYSRVLGGATQMTMTMIRHRYPRAAGLVLLGGGILLVSGGMAHAQFNPQDLLKQVLPGSTENSDDSVASGERACQRYAEKHGLDVRDIGKARRSGTDNL